MRNNNPIIWSDFPDPDVIRVEDTYYMISTTMHFMPGGVLLKSYDLINWEIATYIYEELDHTSGQRLIGEDSVYGKGMWAASLRYHNNTFFVCFVANDTGKTYLYKATNILGPWSKQSIEGFYHDCSLLFDEDDRIYIVYGNKEIWLTELTSDLSGPKPEGLHRRIIKDSDHVGLGYEGSHIYKINGRYYIFMIHWPSEGTCRRTQACYVADSLNGTFVGKDVLDDDMGYHNAGIAQGGIVDTPWGEWYAMLFQDHGAVGRIPVLVPIHWENDFPVFGIFGTVPEHLEVKSTRPEYVYEPLVCCDNFNYQPDESGRINLKKAWQWNHTPDKELWSVIEKPGSLRIRSGKISPNVLLAQNTLTQRTVGPVSEAIVTVEGDHLKDGDYAGICALQGCYGLIALTRHQGRLYLSMMGKELNRDEGIWGAEGGDKKPGKELERAVSDSSTVTLRLRADFADNKDEVELFYLENHKWMKLGSTHRLYFRLDHFVGCRIGLFLFSTEQTGGSVDFRDFIYKT